MYRTIVVALGRRRRRRRRHRRRRRRRRVVSFGWRARRQLCPRSDGWYISRARTTSNVARVAVLRVRVDGLEATSFVRTRAR